MEETERAARLVKEIREEEYRTLIAIEKLMMRLGPCDERRIASFSLLPVERVRYALRSLGMKKLIVKRNSSFVINLTGIELLALRHYSERNIIDALGPIIAKGKESDVYTAYGSEGDTLAIKFFKLGRISFRDIVRKREISRRIKNWIQKNYSAARREYIVLRKLNSNFFPKVLSYNRNTVLLEQISGTRLSNRPELINPRAVLLKILNAVRYAYQNGIVNSDLSEFNVLTNGEDVWLIDWPQAVSKGHPNFDFLLKRDLKNVISFFRKVYGTEIDEKEAMSFVKTGLPSLEV